MDKAAEHTITRRALLATDDSNLVVLLPTLMAPNGYQVTAVTRGSYRKSDVKDYDLLIIDGDPRVTFGDGLPAVVAVSPSDAVVAYDKGVDLVVNKPLVARVFMAKVRAVLRRYGIEI
ncbi:MAG: hypothetical protein NC301_00465 [Bacteroides sp.]|nr:hypothetical protein [Bacteroides sp.]MCM1379381.1 hypothetical protein [Bacteroides sp.]MCM1445241.1 hypothetical protein [Prevotella sp.]